MLKGILTVGGWTMLSRVVGFARDIIFAAVLGTGLIADAFVVAQKLPNLFRRLFGEGAFNAAFVPEFSGLLAAGGRAAAHRFAVQAFSALALFLIAITVIGEIFMPQLMTLLAPGFFADPVKFALTVALTRIALPYLPLICLVALISGMLNGLDRYAAAAAAPVVYNLVCIGFMLGLTPYVPNAGYAFAWGISVSGVVMLALLLIAAARAGMPMHLLWPHPDSALRKLLRRMAPGLVGAGVTQINQMVDVFVATLLPAGSASVLYYANQVQQLPLAVIGTAVGTAILPLLSRQTRAGEEAHATQTTIRGIEYALLLTLPATAALLAIPEPITSVLFQRGAFNAASAHLAAQSLAAYAPGLPAFVLVKVIAPGFFARGDTATPVRIGVIAVALNFMLNIALMVPLRHIGPPLATSLAAWINLALLGAALRRRGHLPLGPTPCRRMAKMLLAALLMGGAIAILNPIAAQACGALPAGRYVALASMVALGGALYFGGAIAMGVVSPRFWRPSPG